MASLKIVLGVVMVIVALISAGEALKCYQCQGEPDGDCAKGVESAMRAAECPIWMAMCIQNDVRSGSKRSVFRGCTKYANPDACTHLYQLAAQNPAVLEVFSCKTCWREKCNATPTI